MFEQLGTRNVLFYSGGLDSTLLLVLLSEAKVQFDIVQFRHGWSKAQRERVDKVIREQNLRIFSYPPMHTALIGKGEDLSIGHRIAIGDTFTRLVRDIVIDDANTKCMGDLIHPQTMQIAPIDWDCVIVGTRQDDTHYAFEGQLGQGERWQDNSTLFVAPLWNWSRQQVKDALAERGIDNTEVPDNEDTGNITGYCVRCVEGEGNVFCPEQQEYIPSVQWNRDTSRTAFVGS